MDFYQSQGKISNRLPKPTNFSNQRTLNYQNHYAKQVQNNSQLISAQLKSLLNNNQIEQQKETKTKIYDSSKQNMKHDNIIDFKSKETKRPLMHQGDKAPEQFDLNMNVNFKQMKSQTLNQKQQFDFLKEIRNDTQINKAASNFTTQNKQLFSQFTNDFLEPNDNEFYEFQYLKNQSKTENKIDFDQNQEVQQNNQRTSSTNNTIDYVQASQLNEQENLQSLHSKLTIRQQREEMGNQQALKQQERRAITPQVIQNSQNQKQRNPFLSKQTINLEQVQLLEEKLAGMLEGLKMNAQANIFSDE